MDKKTKTRKKATTGTQKEPLRQSEQEMAIRNRITTIFLTIPDEEMYGEVLQVILEVMESKYGVFGYIDENGALVVPSMTRSIWKDCQVPDKTFTFPLETWGDSSWPRAIREKKTNYTNEQSTITPKGHIPISRHISMPILYREEVIGLIQVANKMTDYQKDDIQLLEAIGNQIAPILGTRLQRDRQERARKQAEELVLRQAREILEISTPVLQLWEGVICAPLIGTLDSQRTQQLMERLLDRIVDTGSSIALMDITGVPAVDTQTARHLIETIAAVRLLGAQVIVTGIRPAIAQTLVHIGIDLSNVITRSSLAEGLSLAMEMLNLQVTSKE
jgi:anti-anti-sigma regulatory factor